MTNKFPFIGIVIFALFSPVSISLSQIGLGITLLGWIIKKRNLQRTGLDIPILLFFLSSFFSVIFSSDFKRSIGGFRGDIWIITYFLVVYILSYENIKKVIVFLFLGSVISSTYGLVNLKEGDRLSGLIHFCMTFANHQILVFLFFFPLFFYFFKNRAWWKPFLFGLGLIVIFSAIILSLTRGAWIGMFCGILLFFIIKGYWKEGFIGIPLVFIFLLLLSPPDVIERGRSIFETGTWKRLSLWKGGIELWKKSPFFGIGIDNYEVYIKQYVPEEIESCHAHSNYIQILSERGIFGFIAYIFLMFSIFKECFLIIKKASGFPLFLGYGLFSATCGFVVAGISEYTFGDSEVIMLFWFLAGFIEIIKRDIYQKAIGLKKR